MYFIFGLLTISDYGISWDEPEHYHRGQAYLHYFLTGEKTYASLPKYDLKRAQTEKNYHERSVYQTDSLDFNYWLENDGDHPVFNDILGSLSNYIFYQKFGILGDIEAYHLFEIFISAVAVSTVFYFGAYVFNIWTGLFASLFLGTYPLFWSESHFNIKDPVETSFYALTILFFWRGIVEKKAMYIFISSVTAGFAFATKFNILFLPFILGLWLLLRQIFIERSTLKSLISKRFLLAFLVYPMVMFGFFAASWPYIWQDVVGNTADVFKYYENIGLESSKQQLFFNLINPFASRWFIYTVIPLALFFFLFAFVKPKMNKMQKDVFTLWMIWFSVPIIRVSLPGATIYGGIRQIMEFIPAFALIAGYGAYSFLSKIENLFKVNDPKYLRLVYLGVLVIFLVIVLIRIHPNENVYFSSISGGLKRNYENKFPSTGMSLGNAYLQGVNWINKNAQMNSKLALIQGTSVNIPAYWVRPDVSYSNYHWSGIKREGEYLMELTHIYDVRVYYYAWEYAEKMLEPVYQVVIDGVPILQIWKNDFEHTKKEFQKIEKNYKGPVTSEKEGNSVLIEFNENVLLSRLILKYTPDNECLPVKSGRIYTSINGQDWREEGDSVPYDQLGRREEIEENSFRYMFAAINARYIRIKLEPGSCALVGPSVQIVYLE
ncbi:hypothetical protein A2858_03720 [Candidatus Daviesbacteria bacterium RIFCSPHIGHO2_01_FULL_36_37]|uniref:Glycosyltransferase RgtA/B/C/D-like domain-containing protein n=1 Tax=Candidatus Daviesbacteria bacterium RIFCSPHIGHO2_01_FULL_36_37 TaxID=1797758 RepID=A0A1F5IN97_9BACT|nr:MAG: hypothetical protein A2858_03720 [Candidatus Daviesbacteria bacterium RIFCSPHIGHO2_01_FULL_36_37]